MDEPPEKRAAEENKASKKMKVMVAVDESEGSLNALIWALDHLFAGHEGPAAAERGVITLVHVNHPAQHFMLQAQSGPTVYASSSIIDSIKKIQEDNSNTVIAKALKICKERKVAAETVKTEGDPKEMICQVVEKTHVDLVVVGSRGLSKFQRAFLGSVSDYIAHHAKCPVLIVKPHQCKKHP